MSARYAQIAAIMDDSHNVACILRELERRQVSDLILPPIPTKQGTAAYVTISPGKMQPWNGSELVDADSSWPLCMAMEVWDSGDGWMITVRGGDEVGPFDTEKDAHREAAALLEEEGAVLLREWPWDQEDRGKFPLKSP